MGKQKKVPRNTFKFPQYTTGPEFFWVETTSRWQGGKDENGGLIQVDWLLGKKEGGKPEKWRDYGGFQRNKTRNSGGGELIHTMQVLADPMLVI